ncbi:hypothetical protein [Actinoplanes siamensis]|uniref:Uncharacterized protein n=1 Tax=Actinoplanes siamensis TaxID=1223317 RepID=A0A919N981_9ACTN|nr:hypothetical protein [Actinoplanes siamensis]GIF06575.1 hypothetical protein Asi03nite_41130 [Actinoplanes siamensis]
MTALVVAGLSAREVSPRRTAVLLVIALPLWFYLVRRDQTGQSIRMLALGIGWAISTLTLFVVNASRGVDPRLRLSGASVPGLVGGRLLAMSGTGVLLALGYWALVVADQRVAHPFATGLVMVLAALVAAPFGSLVGALLPRELEGALALLSVCAVQMLADPAGLAAKLMPFWSVRQVGTYAVDDTGTGYLWDGLAHFAVVWLLCAAGTLAVFAYRLRLARYPEP